MTYEILAKRGKRKHRSDATGDVDFTILAIRICDLPVNQQRPLRSWLTNRCGGSAENIIEMIGERAHVALIGNVLSFLKSSGSRVDVVLQRNGLTWAGLRVHS